ncbi:MAG: class I SAM-dependent methyltransferase [Desulforudis sp.]|jgi:SAM-dependent methyltransferase|nr:MAG: class I SAM-dependent methyltransferase [Desulforudis sp.]
MGTFSEMTDAVKEYYDKFSAKFINDLVFGNARVNQQLRFFAESIPPAASNILVIGSGSGEGVFFIAKNIAKHARLLALDISSENISMAKALFPHKNITYQEQDVLTGGVEGKWDVIVLPDVYEHIPVSARSNLHGKLKDLLSDRGKIILTVPSPIHQKYLRGLGKGLQIIDEDVDLEALLAMADGVGAEIAYFVYVSVWHHNDYIHVILERNTSSLNSITDEDLLPVKGWRKPSAAHYFQRIPAVRFLDTKYKSWKIKRLLS